MERNAVKSQNAQRGTASSHTPSAPASPTRYTLLYLMPLIIEHGEAKTLYANPTDIEILFEDGYLFRITA